MTVMAETFAAALLAAPRFRRQRVSRATRSLREMRGAA
jgi:hypothetical protein